MRFNYDGEKIRALREAQLMLAHALGVKPGEISPNYYPPVLPYVRRVRYDPAILKARRKELRLILAQTGVRAGLSLEAVHKLEGKTTARPETVRRVVRALGLRPQDVSPTLSILPSQDEREQFPAAYGPACSHTLGPNGPAMARRPSSAKPPH